MKYSLWLIWLFLALSSVAFSESSVGYYIGSFDPPTLGHKAAVEAAMKHHNLSKVYITVNYNTGGTSDKDFNASMDQRVEMLKALFKEYGDRVVILREPLEGRPEFARYLVRKYVVNQGQDKVIGIFGTDTMKKNYKIFTTEADVHEFDYQEIARPETAALSTQEAYRPIIHPPLTVDAEGVSSSKVRKMILAGEDPVAKGLLSLEVMNIVRRDGIYGKIEDEGPAQEAFHARYRDFVAKLRRKLPTLGLSEVPLPPFKAGQSPGAQNDKFVHHIATSLNMTVEQQLEFRPIAEKILGIQYRTRPLRSPKRAAVYLGSFDDINESQSAIIAKSLDPKHNGADVLYIGVLEKSHKQLENSLTKRISAVKKITAPFASRVVILPVASLEESPKAFRRLANEHSQPTRAIFGQKVFRDNYERLKDIPGLTFAMVPIAGEEYQPPSGVEILDVKSHIGVQPQGKKKRLVCRGVADLGGTFPLVVR